MLFLLWIFGVFSGVCLTLWLLEFANLEVKAK